MATVLAASHRADSAHDLPRPPANVQGEDQRPSASARDGQSIPELEELAGCGAANIQPVQIDTSSISVPPEDIDLSTAALEGAKPELSKITGSTMPAGFVDRTASHQDNDGTPDGLLDSVNGTVPRYYMWVLYGRQHVIPWKVARSWKVSACSGVLVCDPLTSPDNAKSLEIYSCL